MYKIDFNDTEAALALNSVVDGLSDMTPFLREVGEFMVFSTKTRFGQGTAPDGTPWAPKSQTRLDAYAARGDRIDTRPMRTPRRKA